MGSNRFGRAFRSRVARRVFLLFVVASLVPIVIVAAMSLYQVQHLLSERIEKQLQQDAKTYGLYIYDRLQTLREEILLRASLQDFSSSETLPESDRHLSNWRILGLDGRPFDAAGEPLRPAFQEHELRHLAGGNSLLSLLDEPGGSVTPFLAQILPAREGRQRILEGRINPDYLWGAADMFPGEISSCVLGPAYQYLRCSANGLHPVTRVTAAKSQLDAAEIEALVTDREMLLGRWVLFLEPNFLLEKLNVILLEDREVAFAQLQQFSIFYGIVILLSLLIVIQVSIHLIRRNTVPLEALMGGIRRMSEKVSATKVEVSSDDEFGEVADAFNAMSSRINKQIHRLRSQANLDELILSRPSLEDIIHIAYEIAAELISYKWMGLAVLEEEDQSTFQLKFSTAAEPRGTESERLTLSPEQFSLMHEGEPLLTEGAPPELAGQLSAIGMPACRCSLMIPIVNIDSLFGILLLAYDRHPEAEELEAAREFGNRLAVAFANAAWERRLHRQANFDQLTGLPNRTLLEERINSAINHAHRAEGAVAVLFIDLDRFKNINDSLGHEFGDLVLEQVAQRLRDGLRNEDTVARLGGDEFVVVLPWLPDPDRAVVAATEVAEKIIELVTMPMTLTNHEIRIATSVGISVYPTDAGDMSTLLRNADSAMYHAKDQGRGNFKFYSDELNAAANHRLDLETRLHRAMEQREFALYYQPIVAARSEEIVGCEALLRWVNERGETVHPEHFIAVAEDLGLTTVIGEWALRVACENAGRWNLPVSVNISARHFHHGNLVRHVKKALERSAISPRLLSIEITETTAMDNIDRTVSVLRALREMGIKISIDDFGSGYSSLNYLKYFPVDIMKIDQAFIANIQHDERDSAIVKSTIGLAHNLGLEVIAEGVETEDQRRLLVSMHCDAIQGFLYSHAVPEMHFGEMLRVKLRKSS